MWKSAKLGDVCNIINGSTPSRKELRYWENGNILWFTIDDLRAQGREITTTAQKITAAAVNETSVKLVPANSVLLCCTASVGEVAIARSEMATNQQFNALVSKTDNLLPEYLYYFASTLKETLLAVSGSATINFVAISKLKNISILLPPLAEQQRIVAKLDAAFTEIDTAIKCNVQKYDELDNLFNSFMGEKFNSEKFPLIKLSEVCDFIGGSQPPKSVFEYEETASNVRLIQIRDYKSDKHIVYIPKDKARRFCSKNDVMIGRYGPPIFQILRGIEGSYNVALMKAVPKEIMLNDYLFYFLKNPKIQNFVIKQSIRAAGQSGVNKDALEPYQMHLPPISHQKEIVKKVSQFEDKILEVKNIYKAKLENLNALKSALLAKELRSEAA